MRPAHDLINQLIPICNMHQNMVNDLAEAMKALDLEKMFGTADWQPQWLHHNFLSVIGLRVLAKIPPSPLSYQQTVALLGLWERRAAMGSQCRALTQSAELTFGLPAVFRTPEDWQAEMKGEVFD